ncbi:hypothetical protein VCHC28A1_1605, partial [Vibrio cholerae HC-28A1]
MNTNPVPSPFR